MKKFKIKIRNFWKSHFLKNISTDDRQALMSFVQNIYWGEDLSLAQAKKNLEEGIVEIVYDNGQHRGNGLLITDNGFIITCNHCIFPSFDKLKVVKNSGEHYPIDYICHSKQDRDIVLFKADIPGLAKPREYKFFDSREFRVYRKYLVVGLVRWDGKLMIKGGYTCGSLVASLTVDNTDLYKDMMILKTKLIKGDSGGIIATINSEVVGIHSSGIDGCSYCTPWNVILEIVSIFSQLT
ncbi:serine protease [Patescibacteria group bacterium]